MDAQPKPLVPWNPIVAVFFLIALYFAAQIVGGLILYAVPALFGMNVDSIDAWLTDSTIAQFSYVLLVEVMTIGGLLLFLRHYKARLRDIGLKRPRWSDLGIGLIAWPAYFVGFIIIVGVLTQFVPAIDINQEQELGFDNVVGALPLILTFISLVILPPLVEEILIRGFLFTSLRKRLKWVGAAVITSLIFAVAHLSASSEGPLYIAAVDTFILSMILCYIREKTGSLWAGIVLHALKNGIAYISLFILGAA